MRHATGDSRFATLVNERERHDSWSFVDEVRVNSHLRNSALAA